MAVYKRTYKGYGGLITPEWSRLFIIPRYAWRNLFQQRFLSILFMGCFFFPIGCALAIYLNSNLAFLRQYMPVPDKLLDIGNRFFFTFVSVQSTLSFILAAFIGPGLISSDLANNALPLYFCRPITRVEYILGKASVIAGLMSLVTWIPGLMLFGLQASLTDGWLGNNGYLAWAIFFGSWVWIAVVTMLALALSAWVRWKVIAGALMLVVMFVGAGVAETVRQVTRSSVGAWFDIASNAGRVWLELFRMEDNERFTLEESIAALALCTLFCVYLLAKKIRATEVIR